VPVGRTDVTLRLLGRTMLTVTPLMGVGPLFLRVTCKKGGGWVQMEQGQMSAEAAACRTRMARLSAPRCIGTR
jgi:hypothetical protein